jgi:hypothetical protein
VAEPDGALLLHRSTQGAHPNDLGTLDELADRLLAFGEHYRQIARPFQWTFTREGLDRVLAKIADREPHLQLAA